MSVELAGRFPAEPLYVDLRFARTEGTLTLRNPRFRAAVLDIAAPLHGRNKDDLDGEDIVQNRRTMRIARGVAVVMALLAAAAIWQAIIASQQRNEAITQRGVAERETKRALEQEGIATEQRDIAQKQTIEAQRQEQIASDSATRRAPAGLALARRLVSDASRQLVARCNGMSRCCSPSNRCARRPRRTTTSCWPGSRGMAPASSRPFPPDASGLQPGQPADRHS